jgi:hypothetical protein
MYLMIILAEVFIYKVRLGEGKIYPRTGHEVPEGE